MKKILLLLAVVMMAAVGRAEMLLVVNENALVSDTTINITEFEADEFDGTIAMGFKGFVMYGGTLVVDIERPAGVSDQLCAGSCMNGDKQARQTMTFDLSIYPAMSQIQLYSHYYPSQAGTETIKYTFKGADSQVTLTVNYVYQPTALETVKMAAKARKYMKNGRVLLEKDGQVFDVNGKLQ